MNHTFGAVLAAKTTLALTIGFASSAQAAVLSKSGNQSCTTQQVVGVQGRTAEYTNARVRLYTSGVLRKSEITSGLLQYVSSSTSGSWKVETDTPKGLNDGASDGFCTYRT